jgi:hypothetical protein
MSKESKMALVANSLVLIVSEGVFCILALKTDIVGIPGWLLWLFISALPVAFLGGMLGVLKPWIKKKG